MSFAFSSQLNICCAFTTLSVSSTPRSWIKGATSLLCQIHCPPPKTWLWEQWWKTRKKCSDWVSNCASSISFKTVSKNNHEFLGFRPFSCILCSHWYLSSLSSPDVFDFTDDLTAHKQRKRETTMWRKLYSQTWCNPMPVKLKTSHYHLSGRPTKNLRMKRQRRHVTFTRLSRWQKEQKQKHNSFSFLTSSVTLLSRSVPVPIRHFCEPKPCVLKKDPSPSCHALQQHKSSHSRGIVNTVNHDSVVFIFLYKINICCLYNYLLSYFTIMRGKKENSTERTILYSYI